MDLCFKFIEPGEPLDWVEIAGLVDAEKHGINDSIFDAVSLTDSAAGFYRGSFPVQSPHFWWGEAINLPWNKDYWKAGEDPLTLSPISITEEVNIIAKTLAATASLEREVQPWSQITFRSEFLAGSEKSVMQGLAVETMLAVDGFLRLVSHGKIKESILWLSAAYKGIVECTCQAQQILGYASENARNAARSRHRENYDMKEQVFAWCAAHFHEYSSMDAAATAIAGKIVPVAFRTARSWVGEYNKKVQSARRL